MNRELPIRDIHLPETVAWWPVAPGWWLLAMLALFFLLLAYKKYRQYHRLRRSQTIIIKALKVLEQLQKTQDDSEFIKGLSVLLRRAAITLYGREKIAGLSGHVWLEFLDRHGHTTEFTQGVGRALLDQPYKKKTRFEREELLKLVKSWLIKQGKKGV